MSPRKSVPHPPQSSAGRAATTPFPVPAHRRLFAGRQGSRVRHQVRQNQGPDQIQPESHGGQRQAGVIRPRPRPYRYARALLPRRFYERPATEVARALLGKVLVHGDVSGADRRDRSISRSGRRSGARRARTSRPRTEVIFGPPGHAYVYLIYGIHDCLNVVAEPEGSPGCVLIRALQPLTGIAQCAAAAAWTAWRIWATAPANSPAPSAITLRHNGADLTRGPFSCNSRPRRITARRISISPSRRASASPTTRIGRCASSSPEMPVSAGMLP